MAVSFVGASAAYQAAPARGRRRLLPSRRCAGNERDLRGKGFETALADALKNGIGTMKSVKPPRPGRAGKGDIVQSSCRDRRRADLGNRRRHPRPRDLRYQDIMKMPI